MSYAQAVSADGGVVGRSESVNGMEVVRWSASEGLVAMGDLPGGGTYGYANGISGDAEVVVGYGVSSSGGEGFRYTAATGMVGLGDLPGGAF